MNVIIKSDAEKEHEAYVAKVFGADQHKTDEREYVECIAARTREAVAQRKD